MISAFRTSDSQAERGRASGVDAVEDRFHPELFDVDATFLVDRCVAVESGGDLLGDVGAGHEVAGQLVDGELVERLIAVQGANHTVAILPDLTRGVDAVAAGVGVTDHIEPSANPAFAVVGETSRR